METTNNTHVSITITYRTPDSVTAYVECTKCNTDKVAVGIAFGQTFEYAHRCFAVKLA